MAIIELHTVRTGNGGPEIVEHWNALLRGSGEPRIPYIGNPLSKLKSLPKGGALVLFFPGNSKRVELAYK